MTNDRLRECCATLGWGAGTLARHANVSLVTARRWLNGRVSIPPDLARVIEQIAALAGSLANKPDGQSS